MVKDEYLKLYNWMFQCMWSCRENYVWKMFLIVDRIHESNGCYDMKQIFHHFAGHRSMKNIIVE